MKNIKALYSKAMIQEKNVILQPKLINNSAKTNQF